MKAKVMMRRELAKAVMATSLTLPGTAIANGEAKFGFQAPQTIIGHQIYDLHIIVLSIVVIIAVLVFAVMFYAILRHRRSVGHQAKQYPDNVPVQVIWTLIPLLIVVGLAFPATRTVIAMKDTSSPDITIKVTGYQWKWRYDYLGENSRTKYGLVVRTSVRTSSCELLTARWPRRASGPGDSVGKYCRSSSGRSGVNLSFPCAGLKISPLM
jgi:heme/copper-type cytochrome/quinol oxidase subunit 2